MNENKNVPNTIYFLLNENFSVDKGYSYLELLSFLNIFKEYYRELYNSKNNKDNELMNYRDNNILMEIKLNEIMQLLQEKTKENEMLYQKICRKLTLWERITGKIKIKF